MREPEPVVREALNFADLEMDRASFEAAVQRNTFANRSTSSSPVASVGRWREDLTAEQVAQVEAHCAPMMERFGYGG